jgi:hypothetical protein
MNTDEKLMNDQALFNSWRRPKGMGPPKAASGTPTAAHAIEATLPN